MRMTRLFLLCTLGATSVIACGASAGDPASAPGTPADTAGRASTLDGKLSVPAGFTVRYFAKDLPGVRFMAVGPGGVVYATQPRSGRVVRLPDANHDGVADSVEVVVSGLRQPHGLAFHKGALWVANTDGVVRVPLGANGLASGEPGLRQPLSTAAEATGRARSSSAATARCTCRWARRATSASRPSTDRATVLRFNEDGSGKRVFASGLRNAVGLAVNPTHGRDLGVAERARRPSARP